jgi:hypothetical protein
VVENPIRVHAQLVEGKAFGDPRLIKREQHCTDLWENINQSAFVKSVETEQNR